MVEGERLSDIIKGEVCRIVSIDKEGISVEERNRLLGLGLIPGANILLEKKGRSYKILRLWESGSRSEYVIGRKLAEHIYVYSTGIGKQNSYRYRYRHGRDK